MKHNFASCDQDGVFFRGRLRGAVGEYASPALVRSRSNGQPHHEPTPSATHFWRELITEEMSVDHVRDRLRVTLPSSLCPSAGSPPADAVVVAVLGSQRHRMWVLKHSAVTRANANARRRGAGEFVEGRAPQRAVYDKSRQNCSWGVQCQMKKLKKPLLPAPRYTSLSTITSPTHHNRRPHCGRCRAQRAGSYFPSAAATIWRACA